VQVAHRRKVPEEEVVIKNVTDDTPDINQNETEGRREDVPIKDAKRRRLQDE
jgi:hypothetical protein